MGQISSHEVAKGLAKVSLRHGARRGRNPLLCLDDLYVIGLLCVIFPSIIH